MSDPNGVLLPERPNAAKQFFLDLDDELDFNLSIRRLKQIRKHLSRVSLLADTLAWYRATNDPNSKNELLEVLDAIALLCGDRKSGKTWLSDISNRTGVVGGVTMMGGSVIAGMAAGASLLLLLPFGAGLFAVGMGSYVGYKLNSEQKVYGDIESRVKEIKAELLK